MGVRTTQATTTARHSGALTTWWDSANEAATTQPPLSLPPHPDLTPTFPGTMATFLGTITRYAFSPASITTLSSLLTTYILYRAYDAVEAQVRCATQHNAIAHAQLAFARHTFQCKGLRRLVRDFYAHPCLQRIRARLSADEYLLDACAKGIVDESLTSRPLKPVSDEQTQLDVSVWVVWFNDLYAMLQSDELDHDATRDVFGPWMVKTFPATDKTCDPRLRRVLHTHLSAVPNVKKLADEWNITTA